MKSSLILRAGAAAVLALLPTTAFAQTSLISGLGGTAGFGTSCIGQNDDGSSNAISLATAFPGGLNFFGVTQTQLYVNTNGNVTFAGSLPTYTASPFPVAGQPMIAPFWADVDTRHEDSSWLGSGCTGPGSGEAVLGPPCDNPSENGIWWDLRAGRAVFTWDRVGYFECHEDLRMSFQLILSTPTGGCVAPGDFDVEFRYNRCDWETGDASGGSSGFGGTQAQAGFDAANAAMDFVMIEGSRTAGIARRLCTMSNVGETGVWRFQVRAGVVLCPDAGMPCTVPGVQGACAQGRTNCSGTGTTCVQQVMPVAERCDNIDNDCDGMTDEMDSASLCAPLEACVRGTCTPMCFEGGCNPDETCTDRGCVATDCVSVTCTDNQRCVHGACVGACDGVTCPAGQQCSVGRCVDLCAGITCDDCAACDEGACVPRCSATSCPSGESCSESGVCIPSACVGVVCSDGTLCRAGTCVDPCDGAVCPFGEECRMGMCIPAAPADAAVIGLDAAIPPGVDGSIAAFDAGPILVTPDGGRRGRTGSPGCSCRAGSSHANFGILALGLVGLTLGLSRRRKLR